MCRQREQVSGYQGKGGVGGGRKEWRDAPTTWLTNNNLQLKFHKIVNYHKLNKKIWKNYFLVVSKSCEEFKDFPVIGLCIFGKFTLNKIHFVLYISVGFDKFTDLCIQCHSKIENNSGTQWICLLPFCNQPHLTCPVPGNPWFVLCP